jgi:hypothetical protein
VTRVDPYPAHRDKRWMFPVFSLVALLLLGSPVVISVATKVF